MNESSGEVSIDATTPERERPILETIRVSDNLTITAVNLEHQLAQYEKNRALLTDTFDASDGIIFEYFSPDIDQAFKQTVSLKFFDSAAADAAISRKEVYVVDPAHDAMFFPVAAGQVVLPVALLGTAAHLEQSAAKDEMEIHTSEIMSNTMSRRSFLKRAAATAVGVAGIGGSISTLARISEAAFKTPVNLPPHQQNLRRIIVAQGIKNLSDSLKQSGEHKNLVLLYPPVHNQGIRQYLENPTLLDRSFNMLKPLKATSDSITDSFFSIRKYQWDDNAWKKTEIREIV